LTCALRANHVNLVNVKEQIQHTFSQSSGADTTAFSLLIYPWASAGRTQLSISAVLVCEAPSKGATGPHRTHAWRELLGKLEFVLWQAGEQGQKEDP
jgi:hypothetical protein